MTAEELIKEYKNPTYPWNKEGRTPLNSMGCNEYWYYPEYSICQTFSEEELLEMDEKEINDLIKLAMTIGEGLY